MPGAIQRVIFDQTAIPRLERALDLTAARHKLLTQNVANAETPGYVRKDIDFASELRASMGSASSTGVRTTRPGHMTGQSRVHACKVIKERPARRASSWIKRWRGWRRTNSNTTSALTWPGANLKLSNSRSAVVGRGL